MDNLILKKSEDYYKPQAARVIHLLKNKYKIINLEGRQYPQIITCLNAIYKKKHSDKELAGIITDSTYDGGLADSFVFNNNSVDIFDFKESENIGLNEIKKLRDRLKEYIFNKPVSYNEDILLVEEHIKRYWSSRNNRDKINVYIVRKKFQKKENKNILAVIKDIESHPGVSVIKLSNNEISEKLLDQEFIKEWKINISNTEGLLSKSVKKGTKREYKFLIIKIPLKILLNLYKLHLDNGKDLFAHNVRYPKNQGRFRTDMGKTVKDFAKDFFIFHNGITITAKDIYSLARNYFICEPQIVNGAQTVGSLYSIYKDNLSDDKLNKASVICKIVKAENPELVNKICETSNTQRAVKIEELRVNDSFQKKLEVYINFSSNDKYEYVRKGIKINKNAIKINYPTFFQWAYASLMGKPAPAKNAKGLLFEDSDSGEYRRIKKEIEKNINKIIKLCDIGFFVSQQIRQEKNKKKKSFLRHINLHIVAGMFLIDSLDKKDFNIIYEILKKFYSSKKSKDSSLNENKFFTKSQEAWEYLKSQI